MRQGLNNLGTWLSWRQEARHLQQLCYTIMKKVGVNQLLRVHDGNTLLKYVLLH